MDRVLQAVSAVFETSTLSTADPVWLPPRWAANPKHLPAYNEDWDSVVRKTGQRRGIARYSPALTAAQIENMEMDCVRAPLGTELPRPKDHVRAFFQEFDFEVGASQGQRTNFIYVEYHTSGVVHGYPITETELESKGMQS